VRYRRHPTRLCVVDPEGSAFYDGWEQDVSTATGRGSRIEGIGRPRVEPSFVGGVVDDMVRVPDAASIATMRWVSERLGRLVGGSTGTNVWASLDVIGRMRAAGESGSVVTLLCDGGERYTSTYYSDSWLAEQGIDLGPYVDALAEYDDTGVLPAVICG
jgi:cysteine synthase A